MANVAGRSKENGQGKREACTLPVESSGGLDPRGKPEDDRATTIATTS